MNRADPILDAALAAQRRQRELRAIRAKCETLMGFIEMFWPVLEPNTPLAQGWAIQAMAMHLEAVSTGEIRRLLINVPPGMMKSLMVGVFWPAWEWGPRGQHGLRILGASYKEDQAVRDTRRMRDLVTSPLYQELWGDTVVIVRGGESDFENSAKGWRKGRSLSSLTGERGDRVIIDDPHSIDKAESDADRKTTVRVFKETVSTRVNDPERSAFVVVMQRLHDKDVSATAMELGYEHLCLPMRFDPARRSRTSIGFVDPRRAEGELLFPERFPPQALNQMEAAMSAYAVASQHQQNPTPRAGGLFKREWFEIVDAPPKPSGQVRAWDLGGTQVSSLSPDPDYTVGLKGIRDADKIYYVTHMNRGRKSPGAVEQAMLQLAGYDGYDCTIRVPQDPGQAGKSQGQHFVRLLAGYNVKVVPVTGAKEVRINPAVALAEFGRIKLVRGPWNEDFLDEVCAFPNGRHDDIVDALADLIDELANASTYDLDVLGGF